MMALMPDEVLETVCPGFLHIDDCTEWDQKEICLSKREDCCNRLVHGVVWLEDNADKELFWRHYENDYRYNSEKTVHVEQLIQDDKELRQCIREKKDNNLHLKLYITFQPCHHSGGGQNFENEHKTSCTVSLLEYWQKVLDPLGIRFTIKCFGIYRAHWEETTQFGKGSQAARYQARAINALNGLRLLLAACKRSGGKLRLLAMEDRAEWTHLLSRTFGQHVVGNISEAYWEKRQVYDAKVKTFLEREFVQIA